MVAPGLIGALAGRSTGGPLLGLLGSVSVAQGGETCYVAAGEARVLALLALRPGECDRHYVAGLLWPDVDEARASGNLRSALWRLQSLPMRLVDVSRSALQLGDDVLVDVRLLSDWAVRVISGHRHPEDLDHAPWDVKGLDLLPACQDDWLTIERERLRQRLLHGLECMSIELVALGRCAEAVEVALLAVGCDGLRESAQRVLINAFLAEGNGVEARRRFAEYRSLLQRELGIAPSRELTVLLQSGTPVPVARPAPSTTARP